MQYATAPLPPPRTLAAVIEPAPHREPEQHPTPHGWWLGVFVVLAIVVNIAVDRFIRWCGRD